METTRASLSTPTTIGNALNQPACRKAAAVLSTGLDTSGMLVRRNGEKLAVRSWTSRIGVGFA
jgi:hypothetical protein